MVPDRYGRLAIRTYSAGGAIPVEDSIVKITGADDTNNTLSYTIVTDRDGMTEKIKLPTFKKEYSQSPNPQEVPYSTYDIEVIKEGYYPKKIFGVAIFEGLDTTLPVNMIPSPIFENNVSAPKGNLDTYSFENKNLE